MVKVHNNVVSVLDAKLNVTLLLFDLSAAFDTVNMIYCLLNYVINMKNKLGSAQVPKIGRFHRDEENFLNISVANVSEMMPIR